jgi:ATP-dependent helicase HepA
VFVRAIGSEFASLGVGKEISRTGSLCSVEYFDAPTAETILHSIDAALLVPYELPEQTRVYHYNPSLGFWEIGRLIDDHDATLYVRFPNGSDRILKASDAFVRWARPIVDPTSFLGGRINETPRFSDGRSGFVRSLIGQRSVTMGMSALASSAIELEAHQIEVVRRVLQDPVQRYLLADEVGLGKTIEAGILIRQCFLDSGDDAQVIVIVPEALVPQWRSELTSKFFLGHLLDKGLHVVALSDGAKIRSLLEQASMLVIDEAHHLTTRRATTDVGLYEDLAAAAQKIERVLLLSATPALHNERGFLEMLHLLDPHTYALDDEAGFRQRIASRQALAEIVAGLTPDNVLFIDEPLDQLVSLFPNDELLQSRASHLRAITDTMPAEDDPALASSIARLRAHVSEVYRLHRRILRHRRRSIGGLTPDRAGAIIFDYRSSESASLAGAIENWRFYETVSLARDGQGKEMSDRGRVLSQLLEREMQYPRSGSGAVGFLARQTHLIGDVERFKAASRLLGDADIFDARLEALVAAMKPLMGSRQQFVVFCSDARTADSIAAELPIRLGAPVDRHDPSDEGWLGFNSDPSRPVLVCDRRAEEGLNLQGGRKIIVHYDLPLNPNRIEQRLGRADRYGSGDAIRSIVLNCVDNPLEGAWIAYLDLGLRVFDRSIASLQYLIEETTRGLGAAIFVEGTEAITDLTEKSAGEAGSIDLEMRNIDQQDSLDALGLPSSDMLDLLTDVDEDWEQMEQDASAWIEQTLQFARISEPMDITSPREARSFRYRYTTKGQHTLVPLDTFYSNCKSSVDRTSVATINKMIRTVPMSYRRRTALGSLGRSIGTRLLRYGDPFVSGMWAITQADDRGRSTAMWRYLPGYQSHGPADLFFRFDYVIDADVKAGVEFLINSGRDGRAAAAAVRRRGDMALAPFQRTIWLNRELQPVTEAPLLRKLDCAYRPQASLEGERDFNLNPKRWRNMMRLDVPEQSNWSGVCEAARVKSEAWLRTLPSFTTNIEDALIRAIEVDLGRLGQLRARAERTDRASDAADLHLETALSEHLTRGIASPTIHLDAILACFVSGDVTATAMVAGVA